MHHEAEKFLVLKNKRGGWFINNVKNWLRGKLEYILGKKSPELKSSFMT